MLFRSIKPWLEARSKAAGTAAATVAGPAVEPGQAYTPSASSVSDEKPKLTGLTDHTILIGYGRVGSLVGAALKKAALPFLVIEDSDKTIVRLQADGIEIVAGNGASADAFAAANPSQAKRLILAIPNAFEAGQVVLRAKAANPHIEIIARAHSDAEVDHLRHLGANTVIMGEREIARGIVEVVTTGGQDLDLDRIAPRPA